MQIAVLTALFFGLASVFTTKIFAVQQKKTVGKKTFATGALVGLVLGFTLFVGLQNQTLHHIIQIIIATIVGISALGFLGGLLKSIFSKSWSPIKINLKIFAGNFLLDADRNFFAQVWQGISRFSWELPQTIAGYFFAQLRTVFTLVHDVKYFGGVTFCTLAKPETSFRWGISLGNFIVLRQNRPTQNLLKDPLLMHEYGHTFDSQIFGPAYLLAIGLPSILGAQYTEIRANRHAAQYFNNKYQVSWAPFDKNYPRLS